MDWSSIIGFPLVDKNNKKDPKGPEPTDVGGRKNYSVFCSSIISGNAGQIFQVLEVYFDITAKHLRHRISRLTASILVYGTEVEGSSSRVVIGLGVVCLDCISVLVFEWWF
jgi:hypothetical protein